MKHFLILLFVVVLGVGGYYANQKNYLLKREYKRKIVSHPESIPNSQTAEITSIGFKNMMSDIYWLQAIQYIGGNAIEAEYKKYLFVILDLITDLNPYFESPYIIGQLLLPDHNERYEETTPGDQKSYITQGEKLGLKGIRNFCDPIKIQKIQAQKDLGKIWKDKEYKDPCKSYTIPYYLAYIYFFYLNQPLEASQYYKIASANEDAPEGAKTLAAIMQGKGGEREKSIYMFLSLAQTVESENEVCNIMSEELQKIYTGLTNGNIQLDGKLIETIEKVRIDIFPDFSKETEEEVLSDTKCINFVNKAIRELNLAYIANANERFIKDHPQNLPARHALGLFEEGYIDFLPTDYQQYEDYGIIYAWDYETERYDYEMGNY